MLNFLNLGTIVVNAADLRYIDLHDSNDGVTICLDNVDDSDVVEIEFKGQQAERIREACKSLPPTLSLHEEDSDKLK